MLLGAIGFMHIRNKTGGTMINPDIQSPDTLSQFLFQTGSPPYDIQLQQVSVQSVLFPFRETNFARSVYSWVGAAENLIWKKLWSPQTVKNFRKAFWRNQDF